MGLDNADGPDVARMSREQLFCDELPDITLETIHDGCLPSIIIEYIYIGQSCQMVQGLGQRLSQSEHYAVRVDLVVVRSVSHMKTTYICT